MIISMSRIVRNKAAEKAKISGYGGCGSPGSVAEVSPGSGLGLGHDSAQLRHPAYSINGILGTHQQPDANANIHSRKREAEGEFRVYISSTNKEQKTIYSSFFWLFIC